MHVLCGWSRWHSGTRTRRVQASELLASGLRHQVYKVNQSSIPRRDARFLQELGRRRVGSIFELAL